MKRFRSVCQGQKSSAGRHLRDRMANLSSRPPQPCGPLHLELLCSGLEAPLKFFQSHFALRAHAQAVP